MPPGKIRIDDGSGNYTILTNAGSLGSDKTITIPNETGTAALTSDVKIKQIVTQTGDLTGSETTSAGFPIVSSLTASITPTSTSAKIIVILSAAFAVEFNSGGGVINRDARVGLHRNNTASEGSSANGTEISQWIIGRRLTGTSTATAADFPNGHWTLIDEPNTTSATSYTMCLGILNTNIVQEYLNSTQYRSSITLLEI
jgi:hypothetical protein